MAFDCTKELSSEQEEVVSKVLNSTAEHESHVSKKPKLDIQEAASSGNTVPLTLNLANCSSIKIEIQK